MSPVVTTKSGIVIEESASTALVTDLSSKMASVLPAQKALITMLTRGFVFHAHPTLSIMLIQRNVFAPVIYQITMEPDA